MFDVFNIKRHLHEEMLGQETEAFCGVSPVENAVQLKLLMTGSIEHRDAHAGVAVHGAHAALMWAISAAGLMYFRVTLDEVYESMATLHRKVSVAEAPPWSSAIEMAWPSTRAICARVVVNSMAVPSKSQASPTHTILGLNHSFAINGSVETHDVDKVGGEEMRPVEKDGTVDRGALIETTGPLATRYHFCDTVLMTSPCVTMAVTEPEEGQTVMTRSTAWRQVQAKEADAATALISSYLYWLNPGLRACYRIAVWRRRGR